MEEQLMQPLLKKVNDAVNEVAIEQGLDMVLRSPALLYVNTERIVDITEDVAKKLGIEVDESQGSN